MARAGHKFIFVVGGVMSGVGKGIAASSMGLILQGRGYKLNLIKIDPYLNVDAGTMNPTEHGEVFVLKSGLETDQDMGNYERFLNRDLDSADYMTSGMVYQSVINRERALEYGGKTVETIPHVRDEILARIQEAADKTDSDISVIEIGGTVGDFQNALFIEAARVLKIQQPDDVLFVMVTYLPVPGTLGEMKTKPTQSAVRELNSYGVQPDFIVARSKGVMDEKRKEKLAIWCNVRPDHIISAPDVDSIYDVPLNFDQGDLGNLLLKALRLPESESTGLHEWRNFVQQIKTSTEEVSIGIVGKYFDTGDFVLSDAYLSVIEAIKFSGAALGIKPKVSWLNSKDFQNDPSKLSELNGYDGIIVPGGFGETGIEGKLQVIRYCRENKIPYFGLCYGMQLMTVEYARNVLGLTDAHTTEINPDTTNPIVAVMDEQKQHIAQGNYGGTMRLGTYLEKIKSGTIAYEAYSGQMLKTDSDARHGESGEGGVQTGTATETQRLHNEADGVVLDVWERHRHRYEVNPAYVVRLKEAGLVFSGTSPDGVLMEVAELPVSVHPFMLGTQAHPELIARPLSPHPLFTAFLKAAKEARKD